MSIPYSDPEKYYKQIPDIIINLSKCSEYILAVASYNPNAYIAIKEWKLEKYFACFRCGANQIWNKEKLSSYNKDDWQEARKHRQISNMLEYELHDLQNNILNPGLQFEIEHVVFFDDNENNIKQVNDELPFVHTVFVDSECGFEYNLLPIFD